MNKRECNRASGPPLACLGVLHRGWLPVSWDVDYVRPFHKLSEKGEFKSPRLPMRLNFEPPVTESNRITRSFSDLEITGSLASLSVNTISGCHFPSTCLNRDSSPARRLHGEDKLSPLKITASFF